MQSDGIIMSYKGAASGDLLSSIIDIAQSRLADIESRSVVKKKVFSVLVEILQNIYHHFEDANSSNLKDDDSVIFILAKTQDKYYITTGNYIRAEDVETLKKRIDSINALSADQLKEEYRKTLNSGTMSEKGGAGLGIMDIARKSGNKLEYEFKSRNEKYTFFSLTVRIGIA